MSEGGSKKDSIVDYVVAVACIVLAVFILAAVLSR